MPEVLILNTDDCCYGVLKVARCRLLAPRKRSARERTLDTLGGHSGGGTPLPIPNREVKPASADGTRGASPRESRTPPSLCTRSGSPRGDPDRAYERRRSLRPSGRAYSPTVLRVELRERDLVLREWTMDDVRALVAGINDPDIAHWVPLIPYPYTEEDAHAFLRGDSPQPAPRQFGRS